MDASIDWGRQQSSLFRPPCMGSAAKVMLNTSLVVNILWGL
jgi:hypothetical protein